MLPAVSHYHFIHLQQQTIRSSYRTYISIHNIGYPINTWFSCLLCDTTILGVYTAASVKRLDDRRDLSKEPGLRRFVGNADEAIVFLASFVSKAHTSILDGDALDVCKGDLPFHSQLIRPEGDDSVGGQQYDVVSVWKIFQIVVNYQVHLSTMIEDILRWAT